MAPGAIDTDFEARHSSPESVRKMVEQVPLGRIGTVQEAVDLIIFHASDRAKYVSGAVAKISAGR